MSFDREPLIMLGRDHVEKGVHALREVAPKVVAATTAGEGASLNPKVVPNEDSLAVVSLVGGIAAVVADSHFGDTAGVVVVEAFARRLGERPPPGDALALAELLLEIDGEIGQAMPPGETSATTAIAVVLGAGRLLWASCGDSLLFGRKPPSHELTRIDRPTSVFMGGTCDRADLEARGIGIGRLVQAGEEEVAPGDLLLLASDGIEELCSGLTLERISALMSRDAPLAARVADLMTQAGRSAYGGGRDNLTVVAIEVE